MGLKYNDNGTFKDIKISVGDNIPVGAEIDYDGSTVPVGYEEVNPTNIPLGTVLWENPNTSQSFSAQDITLSSGDYDYLEIIALRNNTTGINTMRTVMCLKGKDTLLIDQWYGSGNNGFFPIRYVTYVNDTTYTIGDCTATQNGTALNEPTRLIPYKIIGYKNSIPVIVQRDGDVYSTTERVVGTWINGKPIYRRVFTGTATSSGNNRISYTDQTMDTLINYYGDIQSSDGLGVCFVIGQTVGSGGNSGVRIIRGASIRELILDIPNDWVGFKYEAVCYYTKTTDTAS